MLYQLSYSRVLLGTRQEHVSDALGTMGGEGFEPPQAVPTDLQSAPVDHLGIPPFLR